MMILAPLGFIALLSLVGLIIIYILKPKYEEKKVSSSFVWKLSLKYQKNKIPLQKLRSSFLLILQILILLVATFLVVKPHLVSSSSTGEKIIIIESSAGMMTQKNGKTRFDRAIEQVEDFIKNDEKVTIILAANTASYVVRREDDSNIIDQNLKNLNCSYGSSDMDEAISLAALVQEEISMSNVTIFGCKQYESSTNINVIDLSNNEWNVAILNVVPVFEDGVYKFNTTVASFNETKRITIALKVNDKVINSQSITLNKDEIVVIDLAEDKKVTTYSNASVIVEANDSLVYDNEFHLFGGDENKLSVQLVSDNPRFIRTALSVYGNFTFTEIKIDNADNIDYDGYDLYIFDGYNPESLPLDGSIWILDPLEGSSLVDGSISFNSYNDSLLENRELEVYDSINTKLQELVLNVAADKITVSRYTTINNNVDYNPILTCDNAPVLLTKEENNLRTTIFTFDLAYSNLPITIYMPILIGNLYKYSLPNTIDDHVVNIGNTIEINAKPGTTNMLVDSDMFSFNYSSYPVSLEILYPGIYSIKQTSITLNTSEENFYARIPEIESNFNLVLDEIELLNLNGNTDVEEVKDSYNLVFILAGTMFVLLFVEWMVQSREQY